MFKMKRKTDFSNVGQFNHFIKAILKKPPALNGNDFTISAAMKQK